MIMTAHPKPRDFWQDLDFGGDHTVPPAARTSLNGHDHFVQFYETDETLVASLTEFIGAGLGSGEAGIVIATPAHRKSLATKLVAQGIDLASVEERKQFIALDAAQTLSQFMIDGSPDERRFNEAVGELIKTTLSRHRGLRAFGEMVALLWADGNGAAAIRLEELWNSLADSHRFSLFCAYPAAGFADSRYSDEFDRICRQHSCVLPSEKYQHGSHADRLREIATLQQRALALEAEMARRKQTELSLRESEQRYRTLVSLMPAGVYTCDREGRITFYNERAAELWGRKPEPGGSERFCACYKVFLSDGSFVPPQETPMAVAVQQGKSFRNVEAVVERPDGSKFIASINIDPIRNEKGQLTGAVNVFQDITNLKETERQLAGDAAALTRLNALGSRLWQCSTLERGVEEMLSAAIEMLHADFGNIQILEGGSLRIVAQRGFKKDFLDFFQTVSVHDDSACGRALRSGERIVIEDVNRDPAFEPMRAIAQSAGYRAVQSTPLMGRDGKARGMISTHWHSPHLPTERELRHLDLFARQASDFIERCQIDQALRESEDRFRTVLDNSTAIIYVKDCDGKHLLVNERYRRLFNLKGDEILGKTDFDFFPPEIARSFRDNDLKVLQMGQPLEMEEVAPLDGKLRTYLSIKFPLRRADGRVYAMAGMSADITDRKRAEVNSARLAAIVEQSDDAIISKDLNGFIQSWNTGAERLFGYTAAEAIGKSVTILIPPERLDEEPQILDRIRRGERIEHYETVRRRKDGSLVNISLAVSPIRDGTGRILGASKVARDITDKVRSWELLEKTVAERTASLREAVEQMEEFSYSVAHDLRAPLRAMKTYAGVLLDEYGARLDDTGRGYLERIQRASDRMNRLTHDLLSYSRVARDPAQLAPVALEKLIKDILHQYPSLQSPSAHLEIDTPLFDVLGHETMLGQCVANLLGNAVKFIAPGVRPRIRIWTERRDGNVRIWFEDNGIGVRPQHHERIFQMFERVHPEGKFDGTGIGLTIVRKAAERMGGRAGVESDGHNGSRFWIELRGTEEVA